MVRYYLIFLTLVAPPDPLKALRRDSHFAVGGMDAGCAAFSLVCETISRFVITKNGLRSDGFAKRRPFFSYLLSQPVECVRVGVVDAVFFAPFRCPRIANDRQRQIRRAFSKCIFTDGGHAVWNGDAREGGAVFECPVRDGGHTARDGDTCEGSAGVECIFTDGGYAVRDGDACEGVAERECVIIDGSYAVRNGDAREGFAGSECAITDDGHAVRNADARKCGTGFERTVPDREHTIRDGDAREGFAAIERTVPDGDHAVGDGDAHEGFAGTERTVTDGGYAVRDGYACEGGAGRKRVVPDGSNAVWNAVAGLVMRLWIANQCFRGLVKQYAVNGCKNRVIGRHGNTGQILAA